MRTRFLLAMAGVFLVLAIPSLLFISGWWIPNYPSQSDYPIRGIDVSAHQGRIDWKKVSASGIRFVYLKATEGGDFQDALFKDNLQRARDDGLICGAYHFFSLKTPGSLQAQNFIKTVPGELVDLPPAIDLEFWGNSSARPAPETFRANLRDYFDAIQQAYHRPPITYFSADFADIYLRDSNFGAHPLWIRDILLNPALDQDNSWLFWQYSDRGRVPGIDGFVDLDVFNGSADHFEALTRNFATP